MHKLFREVRFSINPFGSPSRAGFNSYASRPCGDGLSVYLCLGVELNGSLDPETGFVVNVSEIDKAVRRSVIPGLQERICDLYAHSRPVGLEELFALLQRTAETLQAEFSPSGVSKLILKLNPFRILTILREGGTVRLYSEQFEFAAMHRLWNDRFTEAENFERFGKCANPSGHGHNYILEVTVELANSGGEPGWISGFQKVVNEHFLEIVDHKNLNLDVPRFSRLNPTVENISSFAWECLFGKFKEVSLRKITVWENDRTCCTYEGA